MTRRQQHESEGNPMTPEEIIEARNYGLITDDEAHKLLDDLQVRGGFDGQRYCGYDYRHQRWIELFVNHECA